mgnify:CR=1 FL=1
MFFLCFLCCLTFELISIYGRRAPRGAIAETEYGTGGHRGKGGRGVGWGDGCMYFAVWFSGIKAVRFTKAKFLKALTRQMTPEWSAENMLLFSCTVRYIVFDWLTILCDFLLYASVLWYP